MNCSFHSLLSNTNSLVILQSFKSLFTDSSHVKFGLPLNVIVSRYGHDLFLCGHKSIKACASQLRLVIERSLLVGQHSAPYNMTSRIIVLYNLSCNFCGTLRSHKPRSQKRPEGWCHYNQTTLIL
jgi:hypothetical protein